MSYYGYEQTPEEKAAAKAAAKRKRNFITGGVVLGVVILLAIILLAMCTTKIQPGYRGVVYNANGGVEEQTLGQGWKFMSPWKHVTQYPVSTETVFLSKEGKEGGKSDDSFYVSTRDGKPVNVSISYSYHMDADHLSDIYIKFRGQNAETIEDNFIRARVKDDMNIATTTFGIWDLYGEKRSEATTLCFETFKKDMAQYHIVIENFSITDVTPDEQSMKAIQDKVNATQALEKVKIEKDKAIIEAEKKKVEAEGEAAKVKIEADAEAYANEVKQQSITQELIQYTLANKWDGKQPLVVGANGTILDIGDIASTAAETKTDKK